jgi:hypothetical protein
MQKEAIVFSPNGGRAWRLASDEGPYLNGFDAAPCPLCFLSAGMVASFTNGILDLAARRHIEISSLVLVQDNRYTMEGSALQGTMSGGALPVDLDVAIAGNASCAALDDLVRTAIEQSSVSALLRRRLNSQFALTLNGRAVGGYGSLAAASAGDPAALLDRVQMAGAHAAPLVDRIKAVDTVHGVPGGAGSSLQAEQRRQLHLRVTCRLRDDGVKEIHQELFSPRGSTFRLLSEEAAVPGGAGRAPDAASYVAAGIAFCFMTQLGRYATILRRQLDRYDVVQDLFLGVGGDTSRHSAVDPVETAVYLSGAEDEAFARDCVRMGEQTCFLHALCRSDVPVRLSVRAGAADSTSS